MYFLVYGLLGPKLYRAKCLTVSELWASLPSTVSHSGDICGFLGAKKAINSASSWNISEFLVAKKGHKFSFKDGTCLGFLEIKRP